MKEETLKCCICGKVFEGPGNVPTPILPASVVKETNARCCDHCHFTVVVPARLACE